MADGTLRKLCMSHSPVNGADLCGGRGEGGGGRVISGRLANRLGSPFGTSGGVNWPYVYAAVFDEFSLREGYRNNALPR